jgi:hypothetical protein
MSLLWDFREQSDPLKRLFKTGVRVGEIDKIGFIRFAALIFETGALS